MKQEFYRQIGVASVATWMMYQPVAVIWIRALGSDQKSKTADTNGGKEFNLKGVWALSYRLGQEIFHAGGTQCRASTKGKEPIKVSRVSDLDAL